MKQGPGAAAAALRQVGRAPLEFGSSQKQSRGVRITQGNSFSIICQGHSQAKHQSCPCSAPYSTPSPLSTAEKGSTPHPVSENSAGDSPVNHSIFQLGELLTCSRFCSDPRTCNSQGHRTSVEEADSGSSPCCGTSRSQLLGAQPDSLSIEGYLHFTGGEGCLEVEVKCLA